MKFGTVLDVVKHFANEMVFFIFISDASVMRVVHRFGNGWSLQSVLGGGWGRLKTPSVLKYKEFKFLLNQTIL
jgi:hypothetical protein